MTYRDALDRLANHSHIARLRTLCDDDPAVDPETRAIYRERVIALAATGFAATPPRPAPDPVLAAQLAALRHDRARATSCPYREACGCDLARCYHLGRLVAVADCIVCLDGARRPVEAAIHVGPVAGAQG